MRDSAEEVVDESAKDVVDVVEVVDRVDVAAEDWEVSAELEVVELKLELDIVAADGEVEEAADGVTELVDDAGVEVVVDVTIGGGRTKGLQGSVDIRSFAT